VLTLKKLVQITTTAAMMFMVSVVVVSTAFAATVTSGNDYPSSLQTSVAANHTLVFTTPSGVSETDTMTFSFSSSFDTSSITEDDIDIDDDGVNLTTAADCSGSEEASVSISSDVITVTICSGDGGAIAATSVVTVEVGNNATSSGTGSNQITNPSSVATYFVTIGGTFGDSGAIALPISGDDSVAVTATVPSTGGGSSSGGGTAAPSDSTAPSISDIVVSEITVESATVTWTTNEAAAISFIYGDSTDLDLGEETEIRFFTSHSLELEDLSEGETYYFQINATDSSGNEGSSSIQTFTTLDETAPVISDILVTDITTSSARVTWATNEEADSIVSYGEFISYGLTQEDGTQELLHSLILTDLTEGTEYHFQVLSADTSSNRSFSSDQTFETDPDETPTNVSDLSVRTGVGEHVLSWTNPTDEDFAGVLYLVCLNTFPSSTTDTDCESEDLGNVEIKTNSGTTDGTAYYYGIFAYDNSGQFASGALVSATSASEEEVPSGTEGDESSDSDPETEEESADEADETPSEDSSTGAAVPCGDNVCSESESYSSCPSDCPLAEESTSLGAEDVQFGETDIGYSVAEDSILLETTHSGVVEVLPTSTVRIEIPAPVLSGNVSSVQLTIGSDLYNMSLDDTLALYGADVTIPNVQTVLEVSIDATYEDGESEIVSSYLNILTPGYVFQVIDGEEAYVTTATATLFKIVGGKQIVWDGSPYDQFNPTHVQSDGTFAWYVPNGDYVVQIDATGYQSAQTDVLSISNFIVNPRVELSVIKTEPEEVVEIINPLEPDATTEEISIISSVSTSISDALDKIREIPGVEAASEVSIPILAITAGASVIGFSLAFDFLPFLQYIFTSPVLLFWRRRRKGHGTIYNAISKTPVDLAVVRLYEFTHDDEAAGRHGRLVKSRVTDKGGRYFFLVPPGRYTIQVTKGGFQFPSDYLKGEKTDGQFVDVYHGEAIEVTNEDAIISANIPLDPSQADKYQKPANVIKHARLQKLQHIVAVSGVSASAIFAVIRPTYLSIAMVGVQIGVLLLARRLARPRKPISWGIVYDKSTGRPLSKVVARIFEPKYNKLLETQVTDSKGRYAFLLGPNQYHAVFQKSGFDQFEITPIDYTKNQDSKDFSQEIQLESQTKE
jgi:hypothetical protein